MTTVLTLHLDELSSEFVQMLKQDFGKTAEIEIHLRDTNTSDALFSDADFWQIIQKIDWSKKNAKDKLSPAVKALAAMPVSHIYLFADKLSEKLFHLDTKQHAQAYAAHDPNHFISADDFLYARCAIVAEGEIYYKNILKDPAQTPTDIVFEPLLNLADSAYELKMKAPFNYRPTYNYETHSNLSGWR